MWKFHYLAIGGAVLMLGISYFAWEFASSAAVGAAAMAKVACSCVFIHERTLQDCRADDPPGFEGITVEIDQADKSVTGSAFVVISRRAKYTQTYGCTLEP